ncbi:lectin subunit alpha-like [Musca vetustissima]|uniref:lectin subunit alpha-like n=1 Tax=Musca vetustissima TaxID=27455 RepID=UPI002AB657B3|nr:lectin subunit alpha-like [Musca vetustissima]
MKATIFLAACLFVNLGAQGVAGQQEEELQDDETNIYKTSKYKYFIEPRQKFTWSQALEECKKKKMNLATIDSKERADDLKIVLNEAFGYEKKRIPRLYIGANDLDEFREFVWIAKGDIFSYTNWEKGEPNNYKKLNERCVHIGFHGDDKWNDINCNRKYGFICDLVLGVEDLSNLVVKA